MNIQNLLCALDPSLKFVILSLVMTLVVAGGIALVIFKCLVVAKGDQAIVRNGAGGMQISFDKSFVVPGLHQYELVNLSIKKLRYERTGDWALQFKCGTRAELTADAMFRLNKEFGDARYAVQSLGAKTLNNTEALKEHFGSMFNDSLETIVGATEFKEFSSDKDAFREALLMHIGTDLNGMVLDDVALYHLRKV